MLMRIPSRAFRLAVLGCLVSACAGCSSLGGAAVAPSAQVRFVQVAPGTGLLDTSVNGLGAAYGLGYESFTSYVTVTAGTAFVRVDGSANGLEVLSTHESFLAGQPYTVVLMHGLGSLQERSFADQDMPAPAGSVALRIINAVDASGIIAVRITPTNQAETLSMRTVSVPEGDASVYLPLPAGVTYSITAAAGAGSAGHPFRPVSLKAISGAVRTVIFTGIAHAGARPVQAFTLTDADAE